MRSGRHGTGFFPRLCAVVLQYVKISDTTTGAVREGSGKWEVARSHGADIRKSAKRAGIRGIPTNRTATVGKGKRAETASRCATPGKPATIGICKQVSDFFTECRARADSSRKTPLKLAPYGYGLLIAVA